MLCDLDIVTVSQLCAYAQEKYAEAFAKLLEVKAETKDQSIDWDIAHAERLGRAMINEDRAMRVRDAICKCCP